MNTHLLRPEAIGVVDNFMSHIHIVSPVHFEDWDWRAADGQGIGGSETTHCEAVKRLAKRGHQVSSYTPIPDDCPGEWLGTKWYHLNDIEKHAHEPGHWLIFRSPAYLDYFKPDHPGQAIWLWAQDTDYYAAWTPERLATTDRMLCLCEWHKRHTLGRTPELKDKISITSNGVKLELIDEVEASGPIERNPKKLIYASSPDRGLLTLCKIFKRAYEYDEGLEAYCYYGCNNIEKLIEFNPRFGHYRGFVEELKRAVDHPGIHWVGRVGQPELYREWLSSGIWCYPTHFTETSAITCMEAQAMGAIPITNPLAALAENVQYGVFIQGDPRDNALIQARYVESVVSIANAPGGQQHMRSQMIPWARRHWGWENWVDQWEEWIEEDLEKRRQ